MKNAPTVTVLLAAALISPTLALVKFPIARRTDVPFNLISRSHLLRRGTITESLLNNQSLYQASVTVGTPPQTLSIDIDTGSSDVYILANNADECTDPSVEAQYGGCFGGVFYSSQSSTFKVLEKGSFQVSYGDKTGASGDFISDDFGIGGATIKALTMGLATQTTTGSGLMGIGYDINEAIVQSGTSTTPYKSIIDTMMDQGLINTKSYSLYLDDLTASSGSIIFGGADTAKFIGPLKVLPIDAENGVYQEMLVTLSGISITNQSSTASQLTASTFSAPVLLDSGTTLIYLSDEIFSSFATAFNAQVQSGQLIIDCAYRTNQAHGFVSFSFGGSSGPVINVPIPELIQPIPGNTQDCLLGVMTATDTYILGDLFLRSAYAVFDLTHNEIGLAQANYEASSSTLVEFKASDSGIPTITGVATGTTAEPGTSGKSAAVAMRPLEGSALVVLGVSGMLSLLGGAWFLV